LNIKCVSNSKTSAQPGSKAALTLANIAKKEQHCITAVNYLFSLKINGVKITARDRRTFVLGFAAAVKSVFRVSAILLIRFPLTVETFQFSQDFLEVFFGIIRARLGGNNNPTVLQFKYALRRILARNQLQGNNLCSPSQLQLVQCLD
jgi:hypothetical protein